MTRLALLARHGTSAAVGGANRLSILALRPSVLLRSRRTRISRKALFCVNRGLKTASDTRSDGTADAQEKRAAFAAITRSSPRGWTAVSDPRRREDPSESCRRRRAA